MEAVIEVPEKENSKGDGSKPDMTAMSIRQSEGNVTVLSGKSKS